jgi:Ni,Fe-hydrogenase III small subunit
MFVLLRELQRQSREIGLAPAETRGSLAVRHVDAGSCNGCEHELNQAGTPFYDLSRYGISIVASPRHADVLLVTGVVTTRMVEPLRMAYASMPEPRLVAAFGNCAAGRDVLGHPDAIVGGVHDVLSVDLVVPGCPPHPERIAEALLDALALARVRSRTLDPG